MRLQQIVIQFVILLCFHDMTFGQASMCMPDAHIKYNDVVYSLITRKNRLELLLQRVAKILLAEAFASLLVRERHVCANCNNVPVVLQTNHASKSAEFACRLTAAACCSQLVLCKQFSKEIMNLLFSNTYNCIPMCKVQFQFVIIIVYCNLC